MKPKDPIRILIAEDHLIARIGVTTLLNLQPDMLVAGEAANGRVAIEMYRSQRPDVVLIDLRMPIVSGIEATAAICGDDPNAKIVVLSTYALDEDVRRAFTAGAKGYLTKDALQDDLVNAIRTVYRGGSFVAPSLAHTLAAHDPSCDLSEREVEVLNLIVQGLPNKQIAHALAIAEHTVKNHVKKILSKLRVQDRTQAATVAIRRGIVHLP